MQSFDVNTRILNVAFDVPLGISNGDNGSRELDPSTFTVSLVFPFFIGCENLASDKSSTKRQEVELAGFGVFLEQCGRSCAIMIKARKAPLRYCFNNFIHSYYFSIKNAQRGAVCLLILDNGQEISMKIKKEKQIISAFVRFMLCLR